MRLCGFYYFKKMKCVLYLGAPDLGFLFVVENPLWLSLLLKLLQWIFTLLILPFAVFEGLDCSFPSHIDGSAVYTTSWSEGFGRTSPDIHSHGSCERARRQQPQAHIYPEERKTPGLPQMPCPCINGAKP